MSTITERDYSLEGRAGEIENYKRLKEKYQAALNEKWEDFIGIPGMMPMTLAMDTALHIAVYSGRKKPLEDLLNYEEFRDGLQVDSPFMEDKYMSNDYGNTALHVAAVTGDCKLVKLLVNSKPELVKTDNNIGETPISRAAAFGQTKIVKYLASLPHQGNENGKLLDIHRWIKKLKSGGSFYVFFLSYA